MLFVIPFVLLASSVAIRAAPCSVTPGDPTATDSAADSCTTSTPPALPVVSSYNEWGYLGCFLDSQSQRILAHPEATPGGTEAMSIEVCLDACLASGYDYAGVEFGQECYCGNVPPTSPISEQCDMACKGSPLEYCGGSLTLSAYHYTPSPGDPANVPSYNDWTYSNCYTDSHDSRSLPVTMSTSDHELTVESCLDACQSAGYQVAGVEWGEECYCGNTLPTSVATDGRCDMKCPGNPLEFCGGDLGINVYQHSPPSTTTTDTSTSTDTSTNTDSSTSTTTAPSTSPSCATTYVAPHKMTCDDVATLFGISASDVFAANSFVDCSCIWAWTPLCIPSDNTPSGTTSGAPPTETCAQTYTSVEGDTCLSIGVKFGVSRKTIHDLNKFLDCDNIWAFTPVCVPQNNCVEVYTSVEGDTCKTIGSHFGLTGQAIHDANKFIDCHNIWTYTPVCIPPPGTRCTASIYSKVNDTCDTIAADWNTDSATIKLWNSFLDCNDIWENTVVCVSHDNIVPL